MWKLKQAQSMWLSKENFPRQFPLSKNHSNPTPSKSVHVKYQLYWLFSLIQIWALSGASSNTENTTFQRVNLSNINSQKPGPWCNITRLCLNHSLFKCRLYFICHFVFISHGYTLQAQNENWLRTMKFRWI